jgi:PIN domain nuclease of toxin-antitoxin system
MRDGSDRTSISAVNLAEVLDVLVRHQGLPVEEVEERLFWLRLGGVDVRPVDEAIGLAAGRLHAAHYHRERQPLSLADCVALATALAANDRLATSAPALIRTAKTENCPVHPLPDSTGRRVSA